MSDTLVSTLARPETPEASPVDVLSDAAAPQQRRRRELPGLGLVLALLVVVTAVAFALFPTLFATHDPIEAVTADALQGPSASHWFGTDQMGRDLFSRVVHGAGASLTGTLIAVGIALVVGTLIGLLAGTIGGLFDLIVARVIDVLLAIPGLLLAMTVVTALGFGVVEVAVAVGIAAVAVFTRLMRAEVIRVRNARYVEAARLSGESWPVIVLRYIAPNSLGSVLALAALEFGAALLAISALSFLGYGVQAPFPEWGALVSQGRDYIATAWWLALFPGLVVAAVVVSMNRISRAFDRDQVTA